MSRLASGFLIALHFIVLGTGCESDGRPARAKVTGTVTYHGQPLPGATVSFIPASGEKIASGQTDTQGKFTLGTFELADGAVLGSHKVTIMAFGPDRPLKPGEGSGIPGEMAKGDPVIPKKYFAPETSGLTLEVTKKGPNTPIFALED